MINQRQDIITFLSYHYVSNSNFSQNYHSFRGFNFNSKTHPRIVSDLFEMLVDEDTVEETLEPKMVYIEGRPKI